MLINWLGAIIGLSAILVGNYVEGGHIAQLIQPTALLIVLGGTLGATLLSSTTAEFSAAIRSLMKVFFGTTANYTGLVKEVVSLASSARREGILALENQVAKIKNEFLSKNLRAIIDGYDPAVLKAIMEDQISHAEEEKMAIAKVWETAGGYSPTIGILGAVLGLIHVMANLSDSSKLGAGIAVAFVATVYGVGAANLLLIPIGNKLKKVAKQELKEMEIIYLGLCGIQDGLNPRVIEDRLMNLTGEHKANEGEQPLKKAA